MRLLFCFCFFFLEKKRWVEALFIGASLLLVPFCYLFFPGAALLSEQGKAGPTLLFRCSCCHHTHCLLYVFFFIYFAFADKAS